MAYFSDAQIAEILAKIRTNGVEIADLTEVQELPDGSYIELSGGRKMAADTFKNLIIAAFTTSAIESVVNGAVGNERTARQEADAALLALIGASTDAATAQTVYGAIANALQVANSASSTAAQASTTAGNASIAAGNAQTTANNAQTAVDNEVTARTQQYNNLNTAINLINTWKNAMTGTNANDVIDTLQEVFNFLTGIDPGDTLSGLLLALQTASETRATEIVNEKIAAVAKEYGAEVPFLRDKSLADDFTGTFAVVKDAYLRLKDSFNNLDTVCCIYATAPLLKAKHLQEAYTLMTKTQAKSVISICEFPFPIQRAFVKDDNGVLSYREPKYAPMRSQDLQKCYQDCGLFYFYANSCFEESHGYQSIGYAMPRHRVIDIDTPEDWDYACALAKAVETLHLD